MEGGSKSVTEEMTAPWKETILPTVLSCYASKDIFNVDGSGLSYQVLQAKQCISKVSLVRHQGASDWFSASNAFGERLPMFVIGKSQNLRCFKGVKYYPVDIDPS